MPNTSHYRIFDYWKDKVVLYSGEVKPASEPRPSSDWDWVVDDWGEPCCWACGKHAIKDQDLERFCDANPDTEGSDFYKKLYDLKSVKSRLNRCHIHPKALGGSDSPENLFLMCEECHVLSPDTTNSAAFFRWVYDRKSRYSFGRMSPKEVLTRIDEELERRGLPPLVECLAMTNSPYEITDVADFMRNRVGFHGGSVVESSWIVGATDWILHDLVKHILGDDDQSQCG